MILAASLDSFLSSSTRFSNIDPSGQSYPWPSKATWCNTDDSKDHNLMSESNLSNKILSSTFFDCLVTLEFCEE